MRFLAVAKLFCALTKSQFDFEADLRNAVSGYQAVLCSSGLLQKIDSALSEFKRLLWVILRPF